MLLIKESDYSVRIVRALANGMVKNVAAICEEEHIPYNYAYKILKKMEKSGILQSLRGRSGGYRLAKSLDSFTLYDVVVSGGGELLVFECLREKAICPRNTDDALCSVHQEYLDIQNMLENRFKKKTMLEITKRV